MVVRAVASANALPPVAAAYHLMAVPVAVKLATVGDVPEQNDWALAVGASGVVLTVTATAALLALSQPETVWLA